MASSGSILRGTLRAAISSGTLMAGGDALCQAIRGYASGKTEISLDLMETARFGIIGMTLSGPLLFNGLRLIDSRFGPTTNMKTSITKTFFGHFTLFPMGAVGVFTYLGILEGHTPNDIVTKITQTLPLTLAAGSGYWPIVNFVSYMYVPISFRIPFLNGAGIFWNGFLSWENSQRGCVEGSIEHERKKQLMVKEPSDLVSERACRIPM